MVNERRKSSKEVMEDTLYSELLRVQFSDDGSVINSLGAELGKFFKHALDKKGKFITEEEIFLILLKYIFDLLEKIGIKTFRGDLKDLVGLSEVRNLSAEIATYIDSLPRVYKVFVEIPGLAQHRAGNLRLSSTVRAIEVNGPTDGRSPLTMLRMLGGESFADPAFEPTPPIPGGFFFDFSSPGYAFNFDSQPVLNAVSQLKQLLVLLQNNGTIDFSGHATEGASPRIFLFDKLDYNGPREIVLPPSLSQFLGRVRLAPKENPSNLNEPNPVLAEFMVRRNREDAGKSQLLKLNDKAKTILDSSITNRNATYIKNAMTWYLDSIMNSNDKTMSFIQLAIALESLLGDDSNQTGKTRILAERCATLVGKNILDRRDIRVKFNEFYVLRSKVVHGEVAMIDRSHLDLVFWAREKFILLLRRELLFNNFDQPTEGN